MVLTIETSNFAFEVKAELRLESTFMGGWPGRIKLRIKLAQFHRSFNWAELSNNK